MNIKPFRCACGYELEATTGVLGTARDAQPEPGSLTVCMRCARVYRFDENLRAVAIAVDSIDDLEVRAKVRRVQSGIAQFMRLRS